MSGMKRRLLVVDDDKFNRTVLRNLLKEEYEILEAKDGKEGLAILKKEYKNLSVILLDIIMPVMDGYQFMQAVRDEAILSSVPIIVITGKVDASEEERCIALGAMDFITKPYNVAIVKGRVNNIVKMREAAARLGTIEHDDLTGLYTKQAFMLHAKEFMDEHPFDNFQVILADIEDFKQVNSIYGEAKGDEVLKHISKSFARMTKEGVCARYGGDRFVGIVIEKPDRDNAKWLGDGIRAMDDNAPIPNIVVKCGVYTNVDRTLSVATMCDRAILAVKSIKRNFERDYASYEGPVSQKHIQARAFEAGFERAIKNEEFVVWFQPKHDARTGALTGAEALVRWKLPDGRMVSPAEFIPVFEEDGLIVRLDEYVFRKVCSVIKKWIDEGCAIVPISVNLSRASLHREGTVEKYKSIAEEYKIPVEYIPIELTESAAMDSFQIKELTQKLKEAGFGLHMDDFGTGVSSLASFNILPFDVIKLDKSLVDFIGDPGGDELLKHTISLAHFKNMKVVAEGVENEEQLEFLRGLGCDVIQGYYYSAPQSYDDVLIYFLTLFREGNLHGSIITRR